MILKKLEMENFLPFYRHNEINFSPQNGNTIILLKGNNGSGKSSTFAAMNFVFFSTPVESTDRVGPSGETKLLHEHDLVNTKYMRENDGTTSVTAHFTHDGDNYVFTRKIKFTKVDVSFPTGVCNVKCEHDECIKKKMEHANILEEAKKKSCVLGEFIATKNGAEETWPDDPVRRKKKQNQYIEAIIPKESSKYYFFDGEKISGYTNIPPSDPIKSVIEKLLGIRMINNAIEDYNDLKDKYEKDKRQFAKTNSKSKTAAVAADQLKFDIEHHKQSRDTAIVAIDGDIKNIKRYQSILATNSDAQKVLEEIRSQETIKDTATTEVEDAKNLLQEFNAKSLPILITLKFLGKIPDNPNSSIIPNHTALTAADCLRDDNCICERPPDDDVRKNWRELSSSIANIDPLQNFADCKKELTDPASSHGTYGTSTLESKWGDISDSIGNNSAIVIECTREITEQNSKLQGVSLNTQELDQAKQDLIKTKQELEDHRVELSTWKRLIVQKTQEYNEQLAITTKFDKSPEALATNACIKQVNRIISSLGISKNTVIAEQKGRIEKLASKILHGAAKESANIDGIRLDKDYTIMIERNNPYRIQYTNQSPIPSPGQKQIIGQSFVMSLTRFAGRERPMFIDSPFMRLDSGYTTEIAKAIVTQSDMQQIMILYQPDEIQPGAPGASGAPAGLAVLRERVATEWEFKSINYEQTEIVEVIH